MKKFKCLICFREKDTEDNIIMYICNHCQEEMVEVKDDIKGRL